MKLDWIFNQKIGTAQNTLSTSELEKISIRSFQVDSRSVQPGDVFVALVGDKTDGHDFIDSCVEKGAVAILGTKDRPKSLTKSIPYLQISKGIPELTEFAKRWRKQFNIPIWIVVGSVGKTTSKEFLRALISDSHPSSLVTDGSQNGFIGIPLTLLKMRPTHTLAVLEVGIDETGAMEQHLATIEPTASLLSALGPEHLERLGTEENAAQEEWKAIQWCIDRHLHAVVPQDDPWVQRFASGSLLTNPCLLRVLKSTDMDSSYYTYNIEKNNARSQFVNFREPSGQELHINNPLAGEHNVRNLALALTLCRSQNIHPISLQKGIENFKGAKGRSQWITNKSGVRLYEDYYNSNPSSLEAAINVLKDEILISSNTVGMFLGDMKELGNMEVFYHQNIDKLLTPLKPSLSWIFFIGPLMKSAFDTCKFSSPIHAHWFETTEDLISHFKDQPTLSGILQKEASIILLKGSRSMALERLMPLFVDVGS